LPLDCFTELKQTRSWQRLMAEWRRQAQEDAKDREGFYALLRQQATAGTTESAKLAGEDIFREAAGGEVVFLIEGGEARFALVAVDEADREVFALWSNPEFLAYLDSCRERAKSGPRKSLREMRESYGVRPEPAEPT
jgi:hypothetical protein